MIMQDFFSKFVEDSFLNFSPEFTSTTFLDAIIVLFWSIILSIVVATTYRETHTGVSYSQNFTQTLVLMGVLVSIVMLIVGTDIARAFTLVGALSIVRFRNAIKETRDVGFIFFTMVVGMACGTRFYILGIMLTLTCCGLSIFMFMTQFGQKGFTQHILEMNVPVNEDYSKLLGPILVKNLKYYSILGIDSIDEYENRLSFVITFKTKSKLLNFKKNRNFPEPTDFKSKLLADLQKIENISEIKVINGSNSIEI